MEQFSYTLQNYRPFGLSHPVEMTVSEGITFILGPNNVGKSALLRAFVELKNVIEPAAKRDNRKYDAQISTSFETLVCRSNPTSSFSVAVANDTAKWTVSFTSRAGIHSNAVGVHMDVRGDNVTPESRFRAMSLFTNALYVPAFRSPTVNAQGDIYGMHIGQQFVAQWDEWANGKRISDAEKVSALVEELRVLFGFSRFEITVAKDGSQLLVRTDEGRFSLSELGDGLSHYIIVLGNAMIAAPDWILIDEPEIGLHPKMQEAFVRVLASKARYGLIATSHSVGLARSVADRVLMMTKDASGARRLEPFGKHLNPTIAQSISEMGYSQFAELGANHLLLVEGRTDIKAFREILRKFNLEQHFLIWSLNGSDWIKAPPEKIADELAELKRLGAASVSIVFDSERTDSSMDMSEAVRPFHDLCASLGFNVFATDRHSTENYITQEALDKLCPGTVALGEFEIFGASGKKWEKSKNWLLFREMGRPDIEGTGLGQFITGTLSRLALQ
ncbi:AAA family ATPase [Prosthecobacter sp.]|uniref:ATP-dependent nuclease n=1 Tax=Prosthecobacter sp. TaxID=1965333 RepID=UPI002ABC7C47|nr:AAA family ATPase [Prosthecobacter sp.]MDZ4402694.1 AAA family ATPase [Prosthecobacter sp.]